MVVSEELKVKQKEEALKRMKKLKLHPNPIREFKKEGKLNASERMGALIWLTEEEQEKVREFEEEYGGLVYHVIHQYTNIGELYSYLYVSKYEEEWHIDNTDLDYGQALAYVYNASDPILSEIGTIGIKPCAGGVIRTF